MNKIPIYFLLLTIIATVNTQEENNSGTFSSAFSKARKNYGPNAVFIWRGKKYTTQLKEELQHDRLFNNESAIDKSIVEDSLFILHTNNTNGALENCYCPDHPLGSLEKRVVFVKEFLVKHPNTILIDVGDFTTFSHDGFKDSLVIIIGGHSQSVIREPKEVNGSLIVQAGKDGYYVGVVQVTYYNNTILTKSGKLEPMLLSMPSDSRVVNMIKEYENYFNKN